MADRRLQIFHAVATHLNFTRAAEALFTTQPTVTTQIRQFEDECRVRLLERSPQGVELTEAGELVFAYARRILALYGEMDRELQALTEEMGGELEIGAVSSLAAEVLPTLLGEFNSLYPKVCIHLATGNSETIQAAVAARRMPLGLIDGPLADTGLECAECGEDELVMICDTGHPLARQRSITARTLADYEYIAREPGSGTRQVSDEWFRAQGVDPAGLKLQMVLASQEAMKAVVAGGLGYAIISRFSVENLPRQQGLRVIPLKPVLKRRFHLVYPPARHRRRVVTCFMEFIQRRLRELHA